MDLLSSNPIVRIINNVRHYGLEYGLRRFYSMYHGKVMSNVDTQQQGRVSVSVPEVGFGVISPNTIETPGTITDTALNEMAYPASIYAGQDHGIYFPPEIGDPVWVSFAYGDPRKPRYMGGWWTNNDPAKSSEGSTIPAEFKSPTGVPFVRGIKTKRGHGLAFGDDPTNPYVELWTGEQLAPLQAADKRHRIIMSDNEGAAGIGVYSFLGHKIELSDTLKFLKISAPPLDPFGVFASSITIDENLGTVEIKTRTSTQAAPQTIVMNALTGTMNIATQGLLTISALGGIAMGSGAPPPPAPPGTAVETGLGAKIINFAGNVTETIGGAVTRTIAGALTEQVAGALIINALSAKLETTGGILELGSVGPAKFFLVGEAFLEAYFNHGHLTTTPGAPTLGPIWLAPPNPLLYPVTPPPTPLSPQLKNPPGNPTVHTTTNIVGN